MPSNFINKYGFLYTVPKGKVEQIQQKTIIPLDDVNRKLIKYKNNVGYVKRVTYLLLSGLGTDNHSPLSGGGRREVRFPESGSAAPSRPLSQVITDLAKHGPGFRQGSQQTHERS